MGRFLRKHTKTAVPRGDEKIFRIRREQGEKGGPNRVHHADVVAKTSEEVMEAAEAGRIRNWRWIDTYDTASEDYCNFEVYPQPLTFVQARRPARPVPE